MQGLPFRNQHAQKKTPPSPMSNSAHTPYEGSAKLTALREGFYMDACAAIYKVKLSLQLRRLDISECFNGGPLVLPHIKANPISHRISLGFYLIT